MTKAKGYSKHIIVIDVRLQDDKGLQVLQQIDVIAIQRYITDIIILCYNKHSQN